MEYWGIYDPYSDTWSTMSITNSPPSVAWHSAVWTGSKMIVWGGKVSSTGVSTGGMYTPSLAGGVGRPDTGTP